MFVDPSTLPGPLRAFVDVNPISVLATACRSLVQGEPAARRSRSRSRWAASLAAVFLPITTRLYRSR